MTRQLELFFLGDEYNELKGIVGKSYRAVRKKYPKIDGETTADWNQFIKDETLLEIAARLTDIATRRQRMKINLMYEDNDDDR